MRMAAERSTFMVKAFPRTLREQLHARAILQQRKIHEVVIELLEEALAMPKQKGGAKR